MNRRTREMVVAAGLIALALAVAPLGAQGLQSGELTGSALSTEGEGLPGVTVEVSSPALIGVRSTVTGENGNFILKGLPPGRYVATFTLAGARTVEVSAAVPLGGTARVDARLEFETVTDTLTVEATAPSPLATATSGANFGNEEIDALPIDRQFNDIADQSPGLNDNTPNSGQVTINGGFAYDNTFLVNGVDITENYFGDFDDLYIEEAIAETQVLAAGVSAEYGRFTGGVVNAITKTGGNEFSGSVRSDLSRPDWSDETPFEKDRGTKREGDLGKVFEATLGGPVVRDRLWFFLAGHTEETESSNVFNDTGIPYNTLLQNDRYQIQLTGNIASNHSLQLSYTDNDSARENDRSNSRLIDPAGLIDRQSPNTGWSVSYGGVLSPSLFAEARYSEKEFGFRNAGGTSRDIRDSPFNSIGVLSGQPGNRHYNAPYFDATDPEDRNNEQAFAALSWFEDSGRGGTHDLKVGVERFDLIHVGGNSQTSTDYIFYADLLYENGSPAFDAQGRLIPRFVPGLNIYALWLAQRGAKNDIRTDTVFVNDRWALGEHWSFNLGARYEASSVDSNAAVTTLDTKTFSPRLAASYDVSGNGRYKIDVTYSEYAGRFNNNLVAPNSNTGNPSVVAAYYVGPEGQGIDFAPGLDPANYVVYYGGFPTQNVQIAEDLHSAETEEWTVGFGMQLDHGGYVKAQYVKRGYSSVIEDFVRYEYGKTQVVYQGVDYGLVDNVRYENTDLPQRDYEALSLQGSYRPLSKLGIGWSWTHQLKNEGNYEGEGVNQPGVPSAFGDYPEVFRAERNFPTGRFNDFQEDKVRLWATWGLALGGFGNLDLGLIYRFDSPLTFSYVSNGVRLTPQQRLRDPGYEGLPTSQTLYYGERGRGEFNSSQAFDLSAQYGFDVQGWLEPWVKFEVRNVLNDAALVSFNTQVSPDNSGPKDADGLPTEFIRGANFGRATGTSSYQTPREYRISLGIRF
ncbi:MAG: carboxypeptidase regulatory-like domain-containing protein [Thermoanaerobaculia bacterium]